jgi:N-acetylglucosamine-6-phosphate deacetylase
LGIHLEGIFLNEEKKGIHNSEHFLDLTVDNYRRIEDDFIKIVTLAPELDKGLIDYLKEKGVKVQAGHCVGFDKRVDGITHTFNAMKGISHRGESTALSALIVDNVYAEVIADGVHVSDDALKLLFKSKPENKVILISDALPITYSSQTEAVFADSLIHYDGEKATSETGTIAGSTKLLPEIIKILGKKGLFNPKYIENVYTYHNIEPTGEIEWNEDFEIIK